MMKIGTWIGSGNMASYSGIFLDDKSKRKLLSKFKLPTGWNTYSEHMTIKLGSLPDNLKSKIGKSFNLVINKIGISDTNIALGVETKLSTNKVPHITFAVDTNHGGKPHMSNQIKKWKSITPIKVTGKLLEK